MRDRFMTGVVTGGIIGVSAGMIAYASMNPRQRKQLMKKSSKLMKNASNIVGMAQAINIMKSF